MCSSEAAPSKSKQNNNIVAMECGAQDKLQKDRVPHVNAEDTLTQLQYLDLALYTRKSTRDTLYFIAGHMMSWKHSGQHVWMQGTLCPSCSVSYSSVHSTREKDLL